MLACCPPVPNVIGHCQVDGMALATGATAEQTRSERLAVARHLPRQDNRKPQFSRYPTTQADSKQERSSAFGTKKPPQPRATEVRPDPSPPGATA